MTVWRKISHSKCLFHWNWKRYKHEISIHQLYRNVLPLHLLPALGFKYKSVVPLYSKIKLYHPSYSPTYSSSSMKSSLTKTHHCSTYIQSPSLPPEITCLPNCSCRKINHLNIYLFNSTNFQCNIMHVVACISFWDGRHNGSSYCCFFANSLNSWRN